MAAELLHPNQLVLQPPIAVAEQGGQIVRRPILVGRTGGNAHELDAGEPPGQFRCRPLHRLAGIDVPGRHGGRAGPPREVDEDPLPLDGGLVDLPGPVRSGYVQHVPVARSVLELSEAHPSVVCQKCTAVVVVVGIIAIDIAIVVFLFVVRSSVVVFTVGIAAATWSSCCSCSLSVPDVTGSITHAHADTAVPIRATIRQPPRLGRRGALGHHGLLEGDDVPLHQLVVELRGRRAVLVLRPVEAVRDLVPPARRCHDVCCSICEF
mmetsp:Transcript_4879/g.13778  ORF Transcript_4879/g.13778 Transcript_4879/m.13778 type:complete len:265 (-) Transcript_4879:57-851(-)